MADPEANFPVMVVLDYRSRGRRDPTIDTSGDSFP
jgi:hypothetical protein